MKRILVTGISGTGKSTLIYELAARGFQAVDADCDEFSKWAEVIDDSQTAGTPVEANRDWVWREERIEALLSTDDSKLLFLGGCAANMGKFLPHFDHIVLLSAPPAVILDRLAVRTTNSYGKHPAEAARVISLIETVEPLLRRAADHEIDTRGAMEDVITAILDFASALGFAGQDQVRVWSGTY